MLVIDFPTRSKSRVGERSPHACLSGIIICKCGGRQTGFFKVLNATKAWRAVANVEEEEEGVGYG